MNSQFPEPLDYSRRNFYRIAGKEYFFYLKKKPGDRFLSDPLAMIVREIPVDLTGTGQCK